MFISNHWCSLLIDLNEAMHVPINENIMKITRNALEEYTRISLSTRDKRTFLQ